MTRLLKRRTLIVGCLAAIGFARATSTKVWRIALVTSSPGAHILDMIRTSLTSSGYEQRGSGWISENVDSFTIGCLHLQAETSMAADYAARIMKGADPKE